MSVLVGVALIVALTVATGYFVAQEFAYFSADRSRSRALAADGDPAAERTLAVTASAADTPVAAAARVMRGYRTQLAVVTGTRAGGNY
jgi:hypothetical protein